jgi:S1-C subfamily serine protease
MQVRSRVWCLAVLGAFLYGCAPAPQPQPQAQELPIKINGVTYTGEAAALDALRETDDGYVAALPPEPDPVHGSVLIVVPDHDRLRPLLQQTVLAAAKRPVPAPVLDFFIHEFLLGLHSNADALVKRGTFERATVSERNDTLNPDIGDADYLVWFEVRTTGPNDTGAWFGRWFVRRGEDRKILVVNMDPGVAAGRPRIEDWTNHVRIAALDLGGVTAAGKTSAKAEAAAAAGVKSGTGIILDKDGDVLTNAHVVAGCTSARLIDAANDWHDATIVVRDAVNDLALLKAHAEHWRNAATFGDSSGLRPGESVVAAGYPYPGLLGSEMSVTTGSLTALAGVHDDSRLIEMSAPVQPGNSGGPLLDEHGNVIGVVEARLKSGAFALISGTAPENVNFAIKAAVAESFLDAHHVPHAGPGAGPAESAADVAAAARVFTVQIECGQ